MLQYTMRGNVLYVHVMQRRATKCSTFPFSTGDYNRTGAELRTALVH